MLTTATDTTTWILAATALTTALSRALVRIIHAVLTAHATRAALTSSNPAQTAHHLAVLHTLLGRTEPPHRIPAPAERPAGSCPTVPASRGSRCRGCRTAACRTSPTQSAV